MSSPLIRAAHEHDLPAIVELYNHYVRSTPVTFDIEPTTVTSRRAWFDAFAASGPHRLLVAESERQIQGYASSQSFRAKAAYQTSVEVSIYVGQAHQRLGVGRALYTQLIEALKLAAIHRAYAGVTLPNPASERLHEALGFRAVGTYDEVGFKLGRFWSVCWYELKL
jgi:phosphinothricin acetyltransferase